MGIEMQLASKISTHELARHLKEMCDLSPDHTFGTSELANYLEFKYPKSTRKDIYNALNALAGMEGFPYVSKGEPIVRKLYGQDREVYPNLWHCPFTGPAELPELRKELTLGIRVAELLQRIAALESQVGRLRGAPSR
jgi:hypothetical protein